MDNIITNQAYILLVIGLYFACGPLAMTTKNLKSALLFKIIPFVSGLFLIILSAITILVER